MKLNKSLGLLLGVVLIIVVGVVLLRVPAGPPRWLGKSAKLPCLANNQCPVGQECANGFCAEGFMSPVQGPSVDMSSCAAKECKGINAPCQRRAVPCPEGTFCQNDDCVSVTAPDQGEAYNQIGMLLN